MADYNLGKAHGEIEIEYDAKGLAQAAASLRSFRASMATLRSEMLTGEAAMERNAKAMGRVAAAAKSAREHVRNLATEFKNMSSDVGRTILHFTGVTAAVEGLQAAAKNTAQSVLQLKDSLQGLTSVGGIVKALGVQFTGLAQGIEKLPQFAKNILALEGAIVALGQSSRILQTFLGRMVAVTGMSSRFSAAISAAVIGGTVFRRRLVAMAASMGLLTPAVLKAASATGVFGRSIIPILTSSRQFIRGAANMALGSALIIRGFTGIAKATKIASIGIGAATLAFAGMRVIGTTIMGLIDAVKQLSGIALILPGAFTALGIAAGVAKLAFMGIGDAFKAAGMEGEDFDKAIKDLSPTMQNIAKAAKPFAKEVKNLRDIAQQGVLGDFDKDIQLLGKTYMPVLQKGISQVSGSLRAVKNEFRGFLMDPNTVRDTGAAFSLTNDIVRNLSRTVKPLGEAFRNLAIVGMEAFRDLTSGAGNAAERLAQFIWQARQSGQLRAWIDGAVQGFRDLWAILGQLYEVSKTVFQLFGADGGNALSRTREALEKFNDAVSESASNGGLKTVVDHLERMSKTSIQAVVEVFRQIGDALKAAAPFMEAFSKAMVGTFVGALKVVGPLLEGFFSVLSKFSQVGTVVGILAGIAVSVKVLGIALIPLTRSLTLVAGGLLALRGAGQAAASGMILVDRAMRAVSASAVVAGVQTAGIGTAIAALGTKVPLVARMQESFYKGATAASTFGRTAGVARAAMTGIAGAASAAASAIGGPFIIAIVAVVGAIMSWRAQGDSVNAMNAQIETNANNAAQGTRNLAEAFKEANGAIDTNVIQVMVDNLATMRQDLDDTASKSTGFFSDVGAFLKDITDPPPLFGDFAKDAERANNEIDKTAETARKAGEAIDELGLSNEELSAKVRGSESDWRGLVTQLHETENGGKEAVASLQLMRDSYTEISTAMAMVTPGGNQLAEAIETIADKSSTAADRLDAMRTALESLGLMSLNAEEAFAQYQQEIDDLSDSSNIAISATAGLGDAMLLNGGKLDLTNENARNLRQALIDLGDGFLRSVEGGQNANEAFAQMQPALQALADAYGLPIEKIQELVRTAGVVPEVIETLVSLKGQDEAIQQLATLALKAQEVQLQAGQPIVMQLDDAAARATLEGFGFTVQEVSGKAGVFKITANTPEAIAKLNEVLRVKDLLDTPPGVVPVGTQGVPQTTNELGQVQDAKDGINGNPAIANVVPGDGLWTTSQELINLTSTQDEINNTPVVVEADASSATVAGGEVEGLGGTLDNASQQVQNFQSAFEVAMQSVVASAEAYSTGVITMLYAVAAEAPNAGAAVGTGFAAGMIGQIDEVRAAATALAEAAAEPLPRSPAKIGPFSGKGWTLYRGRALASGFAAGIYSGSQEAQDATLSMANAISDVIDQALAGMGKAPTGFNENFNNQAGTRYYRDPDVTDEQLAKARADRAEERAQRDKDEAYREKKAQDLELKNLNGRIEHEKAVGEDVGDMHELAKQFNLEVTSNKRDEPGSFHNTGEAWDISGSPADMARLNKYLAERDPNARELFYDPGVNIDEGNRIGAIGGHSDHVHYVPSLAEYREDKATQQKIASNTASTSQYSAEQIEQARILIAEGKRRGASDEDILSALETGFVESNLQNLPYGDRDSEGTLQQRPSQGWGSADETPEQDAKQFYDALEKAGGGTPGQRAQQVQRSAFPEKYDQREAEARALLASIDSGVESSTGYQEIEAKSAEDLVAEMANQDADLKAAVETLNRADASDAEIIRALQTIDDKKLTVEDPDVRDQLQSLQDATMSDRGIKQYDPFEGATDDMFGTVLNLAQSLVGFYHTIDDGIAAAGETMKLLIRGISNTKELNALVDGFQGMANTVGQIVSTIGEVLNIAATIAATAGMAIPGIGQVLGVISGITGGIANVNAVIDLVQDVMHIGGRFVGGFLSLLAGGSNGMLYGNVRTLLDTNDNTIKTWSDRNAADKTVRSIGGGDPRNPNSAAAVNNLNIYQGPGASPTEMMNQAMFAVKAHSSGVWA